MTEPNMADFHSVDDEKKRQDARNLRLAIGLAIFAIAVVVLAILVPQTP